MSVFDSASCRKLFDTVRQFDANGRGQRKAPKGQVLHFPIYRGVTTSPVQARSGGAYGSPGSTMVQRTIFNGTNWIADGSPVKVFNDTKNSTTAAGYVVKYAFVDGYPFLINGECSAG